MENKLKLIDGMYFMVEKGTLKALYNDIDFQHEIPQKLRELAVGRETFIIYQDGQFKLGDEKPELKLPEITDMNFIHVSYGFKPKDLFISELKWKVLMRSVIRGENVMMTGHAGSGKTVSAKAVAKVLSRPFYYFNLGAMQDPRASLIGNTQFSKDKGTYFKKALFVEAISTPYAVILLDELSRAHPDAQNILLTVLDEEQRYLRLDEQEQQETIHVAEGVSFIGTANIGNEYTGTREMDRASIDRYSIIEMDLLTEDEENQLVKMKCPNASEGSLDILTRVSAKIREEYLGEESSISNMMSTRRVVKAAMLIEDGFTIAEALEVKLLPLFSNEGGADSERQFVKNLISSIVPADEESEKNLFNKKVSASNPFRSGNATT